MKIAIIGWGSLIWEPRDLPRSGVWQVGGPELPIEFSRISRDCRLTLVIDFENGEYVSTRYVLSPCVDINDAIEDLKLREGTSNKENIGYVDLCNNKQSGGKDNPEKVCEIIRNWCGKKNFDGAAWTALPCNFKEEAREEFSVDPAINYLNGLPETARKNALKYIRNAPEEIMTPLRRRLKEVGII